MGWRDTLGVAQSTPEPSYAISAISAEMPRAPNIADCADIAKGGAGLSSDEWAAWATDFARRGAAAYAEWLKTAEAGEGAP